jgi:hypothetical protein
MFVFLSFIIQLTKNKKLSNNAINKGNNYPVVKAQYAKETNTCFPFNEKVNTSSITFMLYV